MSKTVTGQSSVTFAMCPSSFPLSVVALTDEGRVALKDAKAASDRAERELLADLSLAEARQLRALLARVVAPSARTRGPGHDRGS